MSFDDYTVCFLILHYKLLDVTVTCVDSILKLKGGTQTPVVIVDNGSLNGSGEALQKHYENHGNVSVMILKESKGFSYANNIGYSYCKKQFHPDLIVVTNNDIVFFQSNFIQLVQKCFEETQFDIMGPDILIQGDGKEEGHGNPRFSNLTDIKAVKKEIHACEKYLASPAWGYLSWRFQLKKNAWIGELKKGVKKILHYRGKQTYLTSAENVDLWGACLIFSSEYAKKREYPFYPETSFYQEENILFYQARKMGMKIYYNAEIKVFHECEKATRDKFKSLRKRMTFIKQCDLEGLKILLDLMEEDKKGEDETFN